MKTEELTTEEIDKLSERDKKKYETAMRYMKHDWACGPWGGWVRGMEMLIDLGWTEIKETTEHGEYVSLIKPKS